jgi:hypothetical protein
MPSKHATTASATRDKLMHDPDDALQWIEESAAPSRAAVRFERAWLGCAGLERRS